MEPTFEHRRAQFKKGIDLKQAAQSRKDASQKLRKEKRLALYAKRRKERAAGLLGSAAGMGGMDMAGASAEPSTSGSSSTSSPSDVPPAFGAVVPKGEFSVSDLPTVTALLLGAKDQRTKLKALIMLRKATLILGENVHPLFSQGPALLEHIYTAMREPPLTVATPDIPDLSHSIIYEACWIISNLCSTSYTKEVMSKPDLLDYLVGHLLVHPTHSIRAISLWILGNVSGEPATCPLLFRFADLGPRLLAVAKDLVGRLDAGYVEDLEGDELEILTWLVEHLAKPLDGTGQSEDHFRWSMMNLMPVLDMVLLKPHDPKVAPGPSSVEGHSIRNEMDKAVYTNILTALSHITADEEDHAAMLMSRPDLVAFTVEWLHRAMAEHLYDEMWPALRLAANLTQNSSEMAQVMISANIVGISFIVLDHPSCTTVCKKEAAFMLSNIATDGVHYRRLLTQDYISRAVKHWSQGMGRIIRDFDYFFLALVSHHEELPSPLMEMLSKAEFYPALTRHLTSIKDITHAKSCIKLALKLADMGRVEELDAGGIVEPLEEIEDFPWPDPKTEVDMVKLMAHFSPPTWEEGED